MDSTQIFILVATIIFVILVEIVYISKINIKKLVPINYLIIFLIFFIPLLSTTVYILYSNRVIIPPPEPKTCPNKCSGNGTCDTTTGKCTCKAGFTGDDCSTSTGGGVVVCGAGFYNDDNICKECGTGTYQDQSGQSVCKSCGVGTYQDKTGQVSCKDCGTGTYQDKTGQTSCTQCGTGTYNPKTGSIISTDCLACGVGTYQDAKGQSSCKSCGTGTYQDIQGQSSCKQCGAGTYQDEAGKISCKQCSVGTYNPKTGSIISTDCLACGAGTYQDVQGQSVCKQCIAGTYQDIQGQSVCKQCLAGTYQDVQGQSVCKQCGAGTYQDAQEQTSCKQCGAGTYQDIQGQTVCKQCLAGTYQDALGQSSCKKCTDGTYQDKIGQASCKTIEETPGLGAGAIFGIIVGVLALIGFGIFFVTRPVGRVKSVQVSETPKTVSTGVTGQVSENTKTVSTTPKIKDTLAQGDCFFSGIYRGARDNGLLDKIHDDLKLSIDENRFIQGFRNLLAESNGIRAHYIEIFRNINDYSFDEYGGTRRIINDFREKNMFTEGNQDKFIDAIKKEIKTPGSYVGTPEVLTTKQNILEPIGIELLVYQQNQEIPKKIEPNTIYLCYNCTSLRDHYTYYN